MKTIIAHGLPHLAHNMGVPTMVPLFIIALLALGVYYIIYTET